MSSPIITLTTDFGCSDSYVAQMKGVILSINPHAQLVDVSHTVGAQNILRAAYLLDEIIDTFPEETIHVVVVDPEVGTGRRIIACEMGGQRFVVPDNGLLSVVSKRMKIERCYEVTQSRYFRETVSNTFHGRDIMVPIAAHWSLGVDASEFGKPIDDALIVLPIASPQQTESGVVGEVLWVDGFGNVVTNIRESLLPRANWSGAKINIGVQHLRGIQQCYAEAQPGNLLALIGSSGKLEIAVANGRAADILNVHVGDVVSIEWTSSNDHE